MYVFGAGLERAQHHFFGAAALGIDVNQQLQAEIIQISQSEIGDFDAPRLFVRNSDTRVFQRARVYAAARSYSCFVIIIFSF